MKSPAIIIVLCAAALLNPFTALAADKAPTIEELWQIIQAQQKEIEALKKQQQDADMKAPAADEESEPAVVAV